MYSPFGVLWGHILCFGQTEADMIFKLNKNGGSVAVYLPKILITSIDRYVTGFAHLWTQVARTPICMSGICKHDSNLLYLDIGAGMELGGCGHIRVDVVGDVVVVVVLCMLVAELVEGKW